MTPPVPRPTLVPIPPFPPSATPSPATARTAAGIPTDGSVNSETFTLYPDSYSSNKQVQTHDGTQRITIQWTPTGQLSYKEKPGEWIRPALTMFHDLFGSDMGAFYPWGSVSLTNWKTPPSLTEATLLDYFSPKITYIRSTKMFIFAVRFGFSTKTPVKWLTQPETKDAMRKHKVWATVSNSLSTSGNLVHAGYILFKFPNLTQRISTYRVYSNNCLATRLFSISFSCNALPQIN
jgi:hypothetical protein